MKQTSVLERDGAVNVLTISPTPATQMLNITVVYHNAQTHVWAMDVYDRVVRLADKESVRATWWKISDLAEPGVLAGAVSTAMRADVIVVAVDAAEGLPFPFNVWVDTWLPHRMQTAGCLIGLVGSSEPPNGHLNRARDYLRAVARTGGFEFLLQERRLPIQTPPAVRQPMRVLRPSLHPVEMRALTGVGRRVIHRAA